MSVRRRRASRVGRVAQDDRERGEREQQRDRPAHDVPDVARPACPGRSCPNTLRAQSSPRKTAVTESRKNAIATSVSAEHDQPPAQEPALLRDAVGDVHRPSGGAPDARRGVDREEQRHDAARRRAPATSVSVALRATDSTTFAVAASPPWSGEAHESATSPSSPTRPRIVSPTSSAGKIAERAVVAQRGRVVAHVVGLEAGRGAATPRVGATRRRHHDACAASRGGRWRAVRTAAAAAATARASKRAGSGILPHGPRDLERDAHLRPRDDPGQALPRRPAQDGALQPARRRGQLAHPAAARQQPHRRGGARTSASSRATRSRRTATS